MGEGRRRRAQTGHAHNTKANSSWQAQPRQERKLAVAVTSFSQEEQRYLVGIRASVSSANYS